MKHNSRIISVKQTLTVTVIVIDLNEKIDVLGVYSH